MGQLDKHPSCEHILDMLPDPLVIISPDYRIVATNRAYRQHYGLEKREVVGRRCHEVSHHSPVPCSQNGEHCPLEEVMRSREPTRVLHIHHDPGGREERVQLQAVPILDPITGAILFVGEHIQPLRQRTEDIPLVGRSPALLDLMNLVQRVAPTQATVLLLGESGSGKERVAEYLHQLSPRGDGPLMVLDCVALGGENLIESELFGYEKGAFTGAVQRKTGLLEAANGGTLVIDEVGELPLALQSKLLRVLETGTIRRLGSSEYRHVDVRMVAATHRDLGAMVGRGEFRHDLYYRLSAFPLRIPPLRERREDIPALAEHFLARMNTRGHHRPLSTAVVRKLLRHDYPGNVRELRNIVERAHILAGEDAIHPGHIHFDLTRPPPPPSPFPAAMQSGMGRRRDALCPEEIHAALESCKGRRADAAQSLGISERTLYRHLNRLREVED